MKTAIFSYDESKTIRWAHGTSTELYIFPSDTSFQKRDFVFRLSTATVEADETDFSDFSGLTRILMILNGNLKLIHIGRYCTFLTPFSQATFDGSWKTKSLGKVRDFNLMFNSKANGTVIHFALNSLERRIISSEKFLVFLFVYNGKFKIGSEILIQGDTLKIELSEKEEILLECLEAGNVICSELELF